MALKGNLRDFNTTQLLNLINLARKTGALTIQSQGADAKVYFKEGKLVHATTSSQDGDLTRMLVQAGKLSEEQFKTIRARSGKISEKELALYLINAGLVTQSEVVQSVKDHVLNVVYRLFTWEDGVFYFEPNRLPPAGRITVPIDLENVIMEGSRRVKEWERLQEELPNLDMALKFTDRPSAKLRNVNLTVEEWRVISFINPRNTIRQIAQSNNMSEFQIRKIVYGMLQAGLVELVRPEGAEARPLVPPGRKKPIERPPAVKRSVINRLIDRIRKL
ncbi:MAG: DUF4388 domain-containing protein [Anaerolineae bacterium]|nr:DUF4388 domain-containing protein [Anaerolineae bacterium]RLC64786.1 MAG: hypothetical protein DRI80_00460 [Chloroflexota bacterium]